MGEHVPDDEDRPVIPSMFGMLTPASDEDAKRLSDKIKRANMESEERMHSMFRTLKELSPEHLNAVRTMLEWIAHSPKSRQHAHYLVGVVGGIGLTRDICPGCGKDHAQELLDQLGQDDSTAGE